MPKKILFCATVDYHFKAFHLPYLKWFKEQGWQVEVAAKGSMELPYVDHKYNIEIDRSPFRLANWKGYKQLKSLIEKQQYAIVHCHTPMGGMLTRMAARRGRKKGTKVLYTAHGFHFCKGGSWKSWLIYYPIEKYLARLSDSLIVINNEDYQLAVKHGFKAGEINKVNGVGVDPATFIPIDQAKKAIQKKSFGFQPDDFLLFHAGEFNKNKNQQFLIHALAYLKEELPNVKLLLVGEGDQFHFCKELATKLGVEHLIQFLGFRKDVHNLLPICDIALGSSYREGLPVSIMEAMACGIPIVATNNRGYRELIKCNENGIVLPQMDSRLLAQQIKLLSETPAQRQSLGENARDTILQYYSQSLVLEQLRSIYKRYMNEGEEKVWVAH
ncbi:glycosyltransferase family 4 protein [Virgibacillus sp. AGTR]|uniref:glycosyltransferase family 4 protein n=1 Tax=unclassified Virgibacillus TaxID=2620237 RepID=UPI000EF480B5|nr:MULTISPECIES: glycosyltransferase family 4 protein [unclassified Virgibacillus]MCC2251538.1 glycosyltransferase family 4 protein [Virgibacillus sp. AGTR]QRZ18970.1 glycosyltransferase family 4 protein [Virgibacillus sp. AGTR]